MPSPTEFPAPSSALEPYLSVVVTTRNDDHGGDPLKRLQALVNSFDAQCRLYRLDAELIVVEWNPPTDRVSVGSLLRLPESAVCTYRFIEVPPALHQRLQYADVLPLFQMIAKNVGIRRARGRFVLATNIDILFSNELIQLFASHSLQPHQLYRVNRHDIEPNVPIDAPLEAQMEYCRTHQLRVHTRWGSFPVDSAGGVISLPEDIVDGRTVRLGRGWHVKEGGDATGVRCYRWASDCAEFILEPRADGAGPLVLDIELQSNPYESASWVEVVAIADDHELARTRVMGQAHLVIPIDSEVSRTERRLELRVAGGHPEARRFLPAFERRDELHYRVVSARIRPRALADDRRMLPYPLAPWANAYEDSGVNTVSTTKGFAAESDPMARSYCIEYGPLRATRDGLHRFDVQCTVTDGDVSLNVLEGDRSAWIPSTVNRSEARTPRRFEIAVDLQRGQPFWIVVSNEHPNGHGVSKFIVHRLEGSEDPATILSDRSAGKQASRKRGWRQWAGDRADGLGRTIASVLGRRLRYRVARTAPEFDAIEQALRASDDQLRNLAPLRHLGDFNEFLRARRPDNLHVNGCGDFQLMAREDWEELRGYPEFETFSMNIDGLFSYVAVAAGLTEQMLDMDIYHFEHEVGSGWSPEGEAALRRRIADRGITWLDATTVYIWAAYMKWLGRPMIFNSSSWGMADSELSELVHASTRSATSQ